jgi:ATP-binding cassette subfamily B protein
MLCTTFISAPITIGIGVFLAIREDGPLSLILLAAIPVLLASIGLIIVRVVPRFRDMQVRIDRVNQVLREQIVGIRVIRAFVREPVETDRFGEANDRLTRTATVTSRYMSSMFPTVMFVLNVSSAAAIWIAGDRISGGEMKIGALIAFLTYLVQILMAVMMATFVAVMWPRAAVCADRVLEVLDTDSSIVTSARPIDSIAGTGALEFRDVSFSYPGAEKPVLSNISFTALPGQTTAIIGSTGSGKTSLVNLIARLIDTSEGTVLVDGVDVRELDPEALWRSVAIVPQKPYLFSGTIRSNLLFADPDATEADTQAAVRNFFTYEAGLLERRHRRNKIRMIRWLTVGLTLMAVLLTLHSVLGRMYPDSLFNDIVGEAFVIAGWVSLWVPIERLGFDGWLLKDQLRLYRRLAEMLVVVVPEG